MSLRKVLVTGMSGLIGGAVRRELEGRYHLSALNRREMPGVCCHRADIADLEAIQPAFEGQDAVVHLSAVLPEASSWESLLATNIIGTYNVFEASRRAGVRRVVYASTYGVIRNYEIEYPYSLLSQGRYDEMPASWPLITHETPLRPYDLYCCTKMWGEALGRYYSDSHGISVICLRIGAVNQEDRPPLIRHFSVWCSQRDVAQMVRRCLEASDDLRYDVFYAMSRLKWGYCDIERARRAVGYQPEDDVERFRSRP